ncbi:synaptonemal complex protein 2 isoform X2 [Rhineura floridana]|uniref:synaptonemal complex protein 2 isoform X2 n=1 Tax=Rhineura floridana TaxID=261503 RepID=UPI002AC87C5D|nr:synaptonemal complex protein 2 isoform X2 [Rhineura floridana]
MPVRRREGQLEKCIDDATRKNDFQALEQFLETDFSGGISHKCSKQFLNKLDRLICQGLDNEEVKNVSTLLNTLQKQGRNISILGEIGFSAMIEYGLVQKMVNWFEKAKGIVQNTVTGKNHKFTTLFEDFFDVLMIVHDTSSEGKIQILDNFILRTCTLAGDKRINIYIQQEAVRKLNTMLDSMPRDTRKKIISTEEMQDVMNDMGKRILEAGDYDLQVAITEALCRMTSEKQRRELASQWFSMEFVSNAFKGINDSEFETDCRKFLNQVNGMLGDKRRVFTYPCLSAILGQYELQIPADDNLEEFWIDFNIGSRSISFYVAADDDGHQWETVCIPEDEVKTCIIEEKDRKKLLIIHLNSPMTVGIQEGEKIILHFDSALEIVDAVRKLYGANKCQGFTKKSTMSVAKTTVHVIFDESGSQVLVPESQISSLEEKSSIPLEEKGSYSLPHQYFQIQKNPNQKLNKVDFQTVQSKITPGKRKVSEASVIVPSTARLSMRSPLPSVNTSTPRKGRVKTALQMMSSVGRTDIFSIPERTINFDQEDDYVPVSSVTKYLRKNNSAEEKQVPIQNVFDMLRNEEDLDISEKQKTDELIDIVPDSQPADKSDKSLLPGILEYSVGETKTQKKQMCWVPEKIISHCNKQNISALGSTFYKAPNSCSRAAKQRAFTSIFEMPSPDLRNKQHCKEEIVEQQHNETNKIPVKTGKINSTESRNSFHHLDEKISEDSNIKIVPSKHEISLNATRMNDSIVNSRHSKLVMETNDDASFDVSSGKEAADKETDQTEKPKEMVEAAEMLISKISNRYKEMDGAKSTRKLCQSFANRSTSSNKSGFGVSKKKPQNRSSKDLKTTLLNITTGHLTDDVYNFNLSGFDEPTIKLGIQEFHITKLEATTDLPKKMNHGNKGKSTTEKKQDKKNRTNKSKKHLFSDTDTECRGSDTKTDISWLRESNRKLKPQLIDYSRTKKQKKSKTLDADKSPILPSMREISQQKKTIKNKVSVSTNQSDNDAGGKTQAVRSKQPRKVALAKICYKELSNSEAESEEECSTHLTKKDILKDHPEHKSMKSKAFNKPKAQQCIVSSETTKVKMVNQPKKPTKSKDDVPKKQMELSPLPSSESLPSLEIMRSCEKDTEEESTEENISVRRSSLSPFIQELTPEKESFDNIQNMSALVKMNKLMQLSEKGKAKTFETEDLSPVLSPIPLSNLSPFTTRTKIISDQDADVAKYPEKKYGPDEAASIKNYPSNRSSDVELKDLSESLMKNGKEGSESPSQLSTPSRSKEELWHEEPLAHIHESGPTVHPNFKRLYREGTESDSDEEEIRREERRRKLLPRKLFRGDNGTYKVSESMSTLSINDTSVLDGESWDADPSSVGIICQKVHKEFARKIQSRSKRMDSFTQQSLKTAHQRMNAMSSELHKCRTKQLEHLHSCLIEELECFEKDSQALRNMEKDFSNFSKKHSETFSTYKKNEQQRFQNLKTSFEKNIYHTADMEENIFTSEMQLMKEGMKGLQEKFLKEMHEEELHNVRKGLQSLFVAEDGKF